MKAGPIEIGTLLQNRNRYCVPIYQRHYVWNKDKQWEPFWLDIRTKAIERLSGRERRFSHFMGAVVLESRGKPSVKQVPSFQVVDGQQRLTTFQLFLTAARHYAISIGHSSASDNIQRYVMNSDPHLMEDPDIEVFKIWPTEASREMFKNIVSSEDRSELHEKYHKYWYKTRDRIYTYSYIPKLLGAYGYFYDHIKHSIETDDLFYDLEEASEIETEDPSDAENGIPRELKLDAIWQSLLEEFKIVEIVLDEGDDAQVIFETLNERGEPLLAADLVRNNIFQRADAARENAEMLFAKHWKPFEEDFWSIQEKQGRYKKQRIEFFLANFISGKIAGEVTLSKLFSEYKAFLRPKRGELNPRYPTVEAEIKDLARYGAIYRELIERESDTALAEFSRRLRQWDVTTIYPLVLRLWESKELGMDDKTGAFETLLSFIVRRAVCNLTRKNYNKFFLTVIGHLDKRGWSLDRLSRYLLRQTAESSRFPQDEEFARTLFQSPMYTWLGPARTNAFLVEVERCMHGKLQESKILPDRLSVEHIIPQSWREHWPLANGIEPASGDFLLAMFGVEEDESIVGQIVRRNRLKHSIGNLSLVTPSFNSKLSNKGFEIKRTEFAEQSLLMLNKDIAKETDWDEQKNRNAESTHFRACQKYLACSGCCHSRHLACVKSNFRLMKRWATLWRLSRTRA